MTLEALTKAGYIIPVIVTMPDKPKGRKLILTASPVKVWAEQHSIPVLQPETLKNNNEFEQALKSYGCDVFVVIAYGKIIPENILNIPKAKSLNIHASLLPKLRGSCPIETAILEDTQKTGITIQRMDALMDHGPIVAMQEVVYEPWPPTALELGNKLVEAGSDLLVKIVPEWIAGTIKEQEQDHSRATVTKKIVKEDGLLDINADPYLNFRKIQAYHEWPQAFFMHDHNGTSIRVKVTSASFKDGKLALEKVIPEGGKEMSYKDFESGYARKQ